METARGFWRNEVGVIQTSVIAVSAVAGILLRVYKVELSMADNDDDKKDKMVRSDDKNDSFQGSAYGIETSANLPPAELENEDDNDDNGEEAD